MREAGDWEMLFQVNRPVLLMLAVSIATVTLLDGCGNTRSKEDQALVDSLEQKNIVLQNENDELRKKISGQVALATMVTALAGKGGQQAQPVLEPVPGAEVAAGAAPAIVLVHAPFTDLEEVPQQKMIDQLTQLGLFDKFGGTFEPFKPITRGEYVSWLFKAHNKIMPPDKQINLAPQAEPVFKDLKEDNPAYKYAQALANAGYSVGYEDGTFRADKPITREEMIGMKVGVDCGKSYDPYPGQMAFVWKFSDAKKIDNRFTGYIHQDYYTAGANGTNIARAFGKVGTFHPQQAASRAEAAGTIWQFGQFEHQGGSAGKALEKAAASSAG